MGYEAEKKARNCFRAYLLVSVRALAVLVAQAQSDFTGWNHDAVMEGLAVRGDRSARGNDGQLHPFIDGCSAAASDIDEGAVSHRIAREFLSFTELLDSGSDTAVGDRKPVVLRIADEVFLFLN